MSGVSGQALWTVEDGQSVVWIVADPDLGLHVMRPQGAWRKLQGTFCEEHRVVARDNTVLFAAEGLAQGRGIGAHEAALGQRRRGGEAGVVARQVGLGDPAVGRRDLVDPGKGQFLGQAVLQGAEGPF